MNWGTIVLCYLFVGAGWLLYEQLKKPSKASPMVIRGGCSTCILYLFLWPTLFFSLMRKKKIKHDDDRFMICRKTGTRMGSAGRDMYAGSYSEAIDRAEELAEEYSENILVIDRAEVVWNTTLEKRIHCRYEVTPDGEVKEFE